MKKLTMLLILMSCIQLKAQQLKIMSYNIRVDVPSDGENTWYHRKEFLTDQIQFYEPDVMGIQEAAPNQANDIKIALPAYNLIGEGREGSRKGESSNILYKSENLKLIKSSTFWLSETPEKISTGWDAAYPRICTYALFEDLRTNVLFWVFNTHLDHIGTKAKINGIRLILFKINEVNKKKYPVILTGDLNSDLSSEVISILKKEMTNSRELSETKAFGPTGTFNAFKHSEPVTLLMDYIFIGNAKNLSVKKHAVLSDSKDLKYPSDHLPVYIEIKYKN